MSGKRVADLGAQMESLAAAAGLTEEQMRKVLMSGKDMSRGLQKEASRLHSKLLDESSSLAKKIEQNRKIALGGDEKAARAAREQLKIQNQQKKSLDSQISSLDELSSSNAQASGGGLKFINVIKSMGAALVALTSVTAILNLAFDAIVKLFKTWYDLEEKTVIATGLLNRELGATAQQSAIAKKEAGALADTFSRLEGSVDGIEESSKFVGELHLALRDTSAVSEQYAKNVLAINRGLGLSVDQVAQLEATSKAAFGMDLESVTGNILDFADTAKIPGSVIAKWTAENSSNMAEFGEEGVSVFKKVSLFAKKLRVDAGKIFEGMKKFDFFDNAAQSINQLNTMMGTSISSFEMMMLQKPEERLEKIRSELMAQGHSWQSMSRYQKMAVSQAIGLTEEETSRLFEKGMSLAELEEEQEKAAEEEKKRSNIAASNQEKLNKLLERSSIVFEGLDRIIQRVWTHLAKKLGPIFGKVFGVAQDGAKGFADIIDRLLESPEFNKFVDGFADAIGKAIKWFSTINWNDVVAKGEKFFSLLGGVVDSIISIGSSFSEIYNAFSPLVELQEKFGFGFDASINRLKMMLGLVSSIANVLSKVLTLNFSGLAEDFAAQWSGDKKRIDESGFANAHRLFAQAAEGMIKSKSMHAELVRKSIGYSAANQEAEDMEYTSTRGLGPAEKSIQKTANASMYAAGEKKIEVINNITVTGDVTLDGTKLASILMSKAQRT